MLKRTVERSVGEMWSAIRAKLVIDREGLNHHVRSKKESRFKRGKYGFFDF